MKLRNWTRHRGALAAFGVFVILDLAGGVVSASLAVAASVDSSAAPPDIAVSAATKQWDGAGRNPTGPNYPALKNLSVTLSQTQNLTNQGITVTWSGGKATSLQDDKSNYLQIMQCWGDESTGPTPQQCQWGEASASLAGLVGSNAAGRGLVQGEDPLQAYDSHFLIPSSRHIVAYSLPFTSVDGTSVWDPASFFSPTSTNEVTAARTGEDGTGQVVFETQTSLEAPHLGCGAPVTVNGALKGRSCWLVVVPRGEFNPDGTPASGSGDARVSGSPLSATNWANRIQFKLGFTAIGASCPIGRAERRTVGSELVADAFTSWQTALCPLGTTYGYSEIGDDEARSQIVSTVDGAAGLGFVTQPLSETAASGSTIVYAPVTSSAIVVAYNIDRSLQGNSPNFAQNGTPVTDLTLNPRLVAKLLTQSYKSDVPNGIRQPYLSSNPLSLRQDPEFLALNPEFKSFTPNATPDGLIVALGSTDAAASVWRWIQADPDARDFLAGTPDDWGMKVNPSYSALNLAIDLTLNNYPKADLTTYRQSIDIPAPGYGTLDMRPYTLDMQEAGYRTLKADANVKTTWDQMKLPPAFVSNGPQLPGQRFELSITTSNAAERYGLRTAKLVNAAGKAVAVSPGSITAGVNAMVDSGTPGVVVPDARVRSNGAYPLSLLTYAAINVCSSDLKALADYRKLLGYAVGTGQVSGDSTGQLPRGYVPLSQSFVDETTKAEATLQKEIDKPVCEQHQKPVASTPLPTAGGGIVLPGPVDTPTATPSLAPTLVKVDVTPANSGGANRFAFLAALLFGLPSLVGGPLLLKKS